MSIGWLFDWGVGNRLRKEYELRMSLSPLDLTLYEARKELERGKELGGIDNEHLEHNIRLLEGDIASGKRKYGELTEQEDMWLVVRESKAVDGGYVHSCGTQLSFIARPETFYTSVLEGDSVLPVVVLSSDPMAVPFCPKCESTTEMYSPYTS